MVTKNKLQRVIYETTFNTCIWLGSFILGLFNYVFAIAACFAYSVFYNIASHESGDLQHEAFRLKIEYQIPEWQTYLFVIGPLIVLCLLVVVLSMKCKDLKLRLLQMKSDRQVKNLLSQLRDGELEKFALYLRPFNTTSTLYELNSSKPRNGLGIQSILDPDTFDLEQSLGKVLNKYGKWVALGRPGEHVGASRIQTSEDNWQNDISLLIDKAFVIVCVPLANTGTMWEVNELKQKKLFGKTIFVMPNTAWKAGILDKYVLPRSTREKKIARFDYATQWEEAMLRYKEEKIFLPSYSKKGGIFLLNELGMHSMVSDLVLNDNAQLRKNMIQLFELNKQSSHLN